jgi:hypothetical protein
VETWFYLEGLGDTLLDQFHYGLLFSVPIFALIALTRRVDLRAAALFALTLPGAITGVALLLFTAIDTDIRGELATAPLFSGPLDYASRHRCTNGQTPRPEATHDARKSISKKQRAMVDSDFNLVSRSIFV